MTRQAPGGGDTRVMSPTAIFHLGPSGLNFRSLGLLHLIFADEPPRYVNARRGRHVVDF